MSEPRIRFEDMWPNIGVLGSLTLVILYGLYTGTCYCASLPPFCPGGEWVSWPVRPDAAHSANRRESLCVVPLEAESFKNAFVRAAVEQSLYPEEAVAWLDAGGWRKTDEARAARSPK